MVFVSQAPVGTKLKWINLSFNELKSIVGLSGYVGLEALNLSSNNLKSADFRLLRELTSLKILVTGYQSSLFDFSFEEVKKQIVEKFPSARVCKTELECKF
ncbi:MAG: hypothetical protein HY537_06195 [Deltaproteobacteria bacterium]|nr:hypothetical protein [Deltaproteobacteria bacterium]